MPTLKSLTLIDVEYRALIERKAAEGDYLFLLNELLAFIHRDGGQYTTLTGLPVSIADAIGGIQALRFRLAGLEALHRRPIDG